MAKLKLPYKNTVLYNQNQTVEFRNKSKAIVFYDKHKQCIKGKEDSDIVEAAKVFCEWRFVRAMQIYESILLIVRL
ncbi:hypothetical protein D3C74_365170 [compost metagenome]